MSTTLITSNLRSAIAGRHRGDVMVERLSTIVSTLGDQPASSLRDLQRQFHDLLADAGPGHVWLALSVLDGELPDTPTVVRTVRAIRLEGVSTAFEKHFLSWSSWFLSPRASRPVEVVRDAVVVDIQHTAHTGLATGIQRVARRIIQRWHSREGVRLVAWTRDLRALRALTAQEQDWALTGIEPEHFHPSSAAVIVPWQSTYVLPELADDLERSERIAALGRFADVATAVVGHDCVPVTAAETVNVGVSGTFIGYLGAVRYMDRVAAVSEASANEFLGYRHMQMAAGIPGPDVRAIPLPSETGLPRLDTVTAVRRRLVVGNLPLVLCVGTHEPRKNHAALLHAAERLWREGVCFSLTFIGANGWHSHSFQEQLGRLQDAGRPVDSIQGISDDELWAAYRIARFIAFPSLSEGFGLPVAEALASGTPVLTSNFGSMAEIGTGGGALLVDPRDDDALAAGMKRLLEDDHLHAELSAAARARPVRTWDQYANELWKYAVEGQ